MGFARTANATVYFVSTPTELQAAIDDASLSPGSDTIYLAGVVFPVGAVGGIDLNASDIDGLNSISLIGAGAASTILDGEDTANTVLSIGGDSLMTVDGVTVQNGVGDGIHDNGDLVLRDSVVKDNGGAGIQTVNVGLAISGSTISGNGVPLDSSSGNSGVYVETTFSAVNSTISGNLGNGVWVDFPGDGASLTNVTIDGNGANGMAGHDAIDVTNTIIAQSGGGDCHETGPGFPTFVNPTSLGHNLVGDATCGFAATGDLPNTNPQLSSLTDNGGPTPTMALAVASPAVNAGDDAADPPTDQRGVRRAQGAHSDIGAFELANGPAVTVTRPAPGSVVRQTVTVAATVFDDVAPITHVDFSYLGRQTPGGPLVETPIGSDDTPPYSIAFDTTQFPNSAMLDATIYAEAFDTAANQQKVGNGITLYNPAPGRIVFESDRDGNSDIWSMDPDGGNSKNLTNTDSDVNTRPSVSPDGNVIAFERGTPKQVWLMNADGSNQHALTNTDQGANGAPAFSPDGSKIAFETDRDGPWQLYVMDADGTNQTRVTRDPAVNDANDVSPSWNPDGTKLAFDSDATGDRDIWTINLDGTGAEDLTDSPSDNTDPDWSPDGQAILFSSDQDGGPKSVWTMDANGGSPQNVSNATIYDADPTWSPDGKRIAFVRDDTGGEAFNVWTAKPDGTAQLKLTGAEATQRNSFPDWSPETLSATVTPDDSTTLAGGINGFTITINNPTPSNATLSSISTTRPPGLYYVRNSAKLGGIFVNPFGTQPGMTGTGGMLTWNGSFTAPAYGTFVAHFNVGVSQVPGDYTTTATASAVGGATVASGNASITAVSSLANSLVIVPEADTYVDAANPTTNFGTQPSFDTFGGNSATRPGPQYGLLRFDLSSLPAGAVVTSARLRLVGNDGFAYNGDAFHHALFIPDDGWTETGVTFATRPADSAPAVLGTNRELGSDIVFYGGVGGLGNQMHLFQGPQETTGFMRQRVAAEAASDDKLSIELFNGCCGPNGTAYWATYYSREAANPEFAPELIVTFATDTPQTGSTFTVNTDGDYDDGTCGPLDCTLREAINAANATPGADTIAFDIPGSVPFTPFTIQLDTALPPVTDAVTIDGTTQPGFVSAPVIAINGSVVDGGDGLVLAPGSDGSTIQGLAVNGFGGGSGIAIQSDGNTVTGSYIGTSIDGLGADGNFEGIAIEGGNDNTIGVPEGGRNVISGNDDAGVLIDGTLSGADGNSVSANYIGLNATGLAQLGNDGPGVWVLRATNTNIGGPTAADGNLLVRNFNDIMLGDFSVPSSGNHTAVRNNQIGLTADGTTSIPNSGNGVEVMDAGSNLIADNTIASTYQGIDICGSSNNAVRHNVIGSNSSLLPDFGVVNQGISIFGGPCPFTAQATGNVIGGAPGNANIVLNSTLHGIAADSDLNTVSYNTVKGTKNGPAVQVDANSNTIGPENLITGNSRAGVGVEGGTGNKITRNAIDGNGGLGIDLVGPFDPIDGITPNDAGDTDTGANDLQNFPVITSATTDGSTTPINATLDTLPGNYTIEVFSVPSCDVSGNGEGATFLAQAPINFAVPNQAFTITLANAANQPIGAHVTITATDSNPNTSEFSNCMTVTSTVQTSPYIVNTNADHDDGTCDFADCTLREAINAANGSGGTDTINFNLPGSLTISVSSDLPSISDDVVINGNTQPGTTPGSPSIQLDGSTADVATNGFDVAGGLAGSTIRGLSITGFSGAGIYLEADGAPSTVEGNFIGIKPDGVTAAGNGTDGFGDAGIAIRSSDNRVGGTTAATRNVISGNVGSGIDFLDGTGNVVIGNRIGTNAAGSAPVPNTTDGLAFEDVSFQAIGGTAAGEGNLISGNGANGIFLNSGYDFQTATIQGNKIGLAANGTTPLPNGDAGVRIEGVDDVHVGGSAAGAGNVISGNTGDGVFLSGTANSVIQGNYIGTSASGTQAVGNAVGVHINDADNNAIGGGSTAEGNVISGNIGAGVLIDGFSDTNVVENNFIGTDNGGTLDLGNTANGVLLSSAAQNNIVRGNTIAHNAGAGIAIPGSPPLHNTVTTNSIDLNGGLGIDLGPNGVTPNDPVPDTDHFQNFPTITSVSGSSVNGTLASIPGTTFNIELFVTPTCDGSTRGEGRTYLGTTTVVTDGFGNGSFTANVGSLPSGQVVTGTATNPTGDTSEFSNCVTTVPPVLATNLSLTPTPVSSPAGAARVKLSDVPPLALILSQASPLSAPVNQSPVNQSPVNQTPVNQLAGTNAPVNQTPINQSPVNQTPVNQSGFAELTQSIPQLGNITLSTIPLLRTGGWATVLTGTALAGQPEQSVTLRQVYSLNPLPAPLQPGASNPIKLGELDLSRSALGNLPAIAFTLGKLPLSQIKTTVGATTTFTNWCTSANILGVDCTGTVSSPATILSTSIQGAPVNQSPVNQSPVNQSLIQALAAYGAPVNQTPVNQTPINQSRIGALPVNQTPVNQTPVNQSPVNQLSLQPILANNAPVNQSPVNQTPVNQLSTPNDLFYCVGPAPSGKTVINCATATLKDAVNSVRPNVTLGDLRIHAPSSSTLANWTIADLRYFGNMTIGDLLASLPQPNTFTLADVLLLVLGSPTGVQGLSFEGINLFDTNLQASATGGSTVTYRAGFTVSPNGGPSGVANTVSVSSTIAKDFLYVPGSSRLATGTSCVGTVLADPTSTTLNDGRLKLTWAAPTNVGSTYSLCFTTRPPLVLGLDGASLDAQPTGGSPAPTAAATTLNVGDTNEPNDAPSTSPLISTDSFYLSYLTSASDVDYYRFTAPAAGTVMTFHLSHLPTDYDLVVYGPPGAALRPPLTSGAVPLDEAPVTDSGVDLTNTTSALPSQTLDDLRLQTDLPMVGVSASRNTDPEDVVVISQGTGTYTVQITGYNGATSPKPYMLRVGAAPPAQVANVSSRTITGTAGPTLPSLPSGLNTVFLLNRTQLQGMYGSTRATNVVNALSNTSAGFTSRGFPNVVLSVDRFTSVQNAYTAWNANPGSPAAANAVVQAINGVVDSQIRSQPNGAGLKYLVIVGGDQIIPLARLDDFTVTASNESGYANTFPTNSDLFASLNAGQMLSDDPYGDVNPVPYLTRQLYIPELAVGRLVETPEDIIGTLTRFATFNGRLDPTTSLTTGYDFLFDGAQGVNAPFNTRFGTNAKTLFDDPAHTGDSWTLSQLIGAFLPTATGTSSPSITSLNGHASHFQFQPPNNDATGAREQLLTTSTVTASGAALTNRLIFSMGCHAGLSVADSIVTGTMLDWPQTFAQKGVGAFLGNTGYGYGDSLVVAYSEELNRLFAERVAAGATVGDALAAAKQAYYGELGVFGVYDEKAMAEFTLYGLPMWSVGAPAGAAQAQAEAFAAPDSASAPMAASVNDSSPAAQSQAATTDPTTGLDAETFSVDPANTPHQTTDGKYWSGPDGVQVTHLRPIQPKALVGLSGTTAHGALLTELTSGDTDCIDPVFDRPIVDSSLTENELRFADVAFPSKVQTVRTFETPTGRVQQLVLVTGQFFTQACSTNPDPQLGVQRLFSHIAGRVFRSGSTDYIAPGFQQIDATQVSGNAAFIVDVTDKTPTGNGTVKQVLVGVRSGIATNWTFVNLTQSPSNAARWTGGVPITGTNFEYFVQAVDTNGNVGVSTNKGFYFDGAPPPPPPTGTVTATLPAGPKTNGWFTTGTLATVHAPQDVTVQASVDGAAYASVPACSPATNPPTFCAPISGDGVHTIDVRASNGDTVSLIAPIDGTPPSVTINTPANGAQYVLNSVVKADYFCTDGGSGIASGCSGPVANGANIDTTCASPPCTKNFTVSAPTDVAGHTGAEKTVTYTVVRYRKVLFSSARSGGGDIYAMNADGSGAATQLTSTAGLDEQPSWSPDGSKIAFASAGGGKGGNGNNLDIYVMDANGANVRQLTTASGDDTAPSWSADGSKIAFQSKRDGSGAEIYVMNNDGTNQKRLTFNATQDSEPSWSPNGQKITFLSNRTGTVNVWAMNSNGTNQTQLTATSAPDGTPSFSPAGTKILFASKRGSNGGTVFDIYTMNPDGSGVSRLTNSKNGDFEPSWARDGTKIAFTSLRDGNQEIYTMNANGAGVALRLTNNSAIDNQPDW